MRNLFLLAALATLTLAACNSNRKVDNTDIEKNKSTPDGPDNRNSGPKGTPAFKETLFDFGKITDGEIVQHKFKLRNTGKGSLTIGRVQAACGCTTPEWTKEVIPPNGEGEVLATFNSEGRGDEQGTPVEKSITVTFTNSTVDEIVLRFVSKIYKKEEKNKP